MTDKIDLNVWDRDFSLTVDFDCCEDEPILKEQTDAYEKFISNLGWIDKAKKKVEKYCKKAVKEDPENEKKDNMFSYIKPKCLFIKREEDKPRVALLCNYRYDEEHGLAVVFAHDGKVTVGSQDIIL